MNAFILLFAFATLAKATYYQPVYHFAPAPLNHDGTVADTPEVAAAKHAHLAELAKAGGATQVYAPSYHGGGQIYSNHWQVPAPLNHDGTVDETPEVKHAKAVHFAAHAKALSQLHYSQSPSLHTTFAQSVAHSPLSYSHYAPYHQSAPLNHDGTVAETPEVQHAKAVHFAAHAAARSHYPQHDSSYIADTPEVEHAKALHFAAYQNVLHRGKRSYESYAPIYSGYHGPPAPLNHDGTVDDTPEVKHAKAEHFAAHAQAKHGIVYNPPQSVEPYYHSVQPVEPVYHTVQSVQPVYHTVQSVGPIYHSIGEVQPFQYSQQPSYHHQIPAPLNHDGTVAETPEIIARKIEHFAAHDKALSQISHSHYH